MAPSRVPHRERAPRPYLRMMPSTVSAAVSADTRVSATIQDA